MRGHTMWRGAEQSSDNDTERRMDWAETSPMKTDGQ